MKRKAPSKVIKARTRKALAAAPVETILVLRTCKADMTSHSGFTWPRSGPVECPNWRNTPECGRGLHGFARGLGDGSLASWEADAIWLVVEVALADVIDLEGKVKFPRGVVAYAGTRDEATRIIAERHPGGAIIGYAATAGHSGTATAGCKGTATAGDSGTATAGYNGTATAGDSGTATAGDSGALVLRYFDGKRFRLAVAYVGEDGIKANTAYRLGAQREFVEVA